MGRPNDSDDADLIRFKTVVLDNPLAGDDVALVKVEFCPGARLYSYTFSACATAELITVPDVLATWQSQESQLDLVSCGCRIAEIRADLPGLRLPAFMKLSAPPGIRTTLQLTYGHCT